MQEAALPILVVTYALLSLTRFRGFQLNRPVASLLGAGLMVAFGVLTWRGALDAVADGLEILALLLGMMVMVATLEVAGFFEYLASRMASRAGSRRAFFVQVCLASAVLSALVLNDTVVLLLTPVVIKTCKRLEANPVPFLMAETICANIGSAATVIGNPQNAYIGIQSGVSFLRFGAVMAPIATLCLIVSIWMMLRFFERDLRAPLGAGAGLPAGEAPPLDPTLIRIAGVVLACVVGLFVLSSTLGLSVAEIAMGGAVAMLFSTVGYRRFRVETILARVDWTILLLFCGLFVVLRGVEDAHLVEGLVATVASVGSGGSDPATLGVLSGVSAVLSNLISNVPAVLLLAPVAAALGGEKAWLILASSSTLAGNATILGAAANLITAEVARAHGLEFSWLRFTKIGLPVAAVTLIISTLALAYFPF